MALRKKKRLYRGNGNILVTAPAIEPVTADELRAHLRETASGLPDTEADELIKAAREAIERAIGIALISQTWGMTLDSWPARARSVDLPRYPVSSVSDVMVYGSDGVGTAVVINDVFIVDTTRAKGRLSLKYGASWPIAAMSANSIQITYVAGYGAAHADVPADLRRAVKMSAAYMYSNRGDGCDAGTALAASGAASIVSAYRVARI